MNMSTKILKTKRPINKSGTLNHCAPGCIDPYFVFAKKLKMMLICREE